MSEPQTVPARWNARTISRTGWSGHVASDQAGMWGHIKVPGRGQGGRIAAKVDAFAFQVASTSNEICPPQSRFRHYLKHVSEPQTQCLNLKLLPARLECAEATKTVRFKKQLVLQIAEQVAETSNSTGQAESAEIPDVALPSLHFPNATRSSLARRNARSDEKLFDSNSDPRARR